MPSRETVHAQMLYCSKTALTAGVASSHSKGRQGLARENGTTEAVRFCDQSGSAVFVTGAEAFKECCEDMRPCMHAGNFFLGNEIDVKPVLQTNPPCFLES